MTSCTIKCIDTRRPYKIEVPSPERTLRISLPSQILDNPVIVACLFSFFNPCPPRNSPPSSEKIAIEGKLSSNSLNIPENVGSLHVKMGRIGFSGSLPKAFKAIIWSSSSSVTLLRIL